VVESARAAKKSFEIDIAEAFGEELASSRRMAERP